VRNLIRKGTQRLLPEGYDVDTHFKPKYSPWDQRMCLVPDADLFEAISSGKASMVTDGIETFTEKGLRLTSGEELEADIIVTATGLNLQLFGGAEIVVDEKPVDMADTLFYKGMMFSGIPNLTYVVGYTNASWTLKADLVLDHTCRLINHMDERGQAIAVPRAPASIGKQDFIDLKAGYVLRALDRLPKQGETLPWKLHQNYARDIFMLKRGPVDDEGLEISGARKRDETLTAA
jgi:monooxygenase